MTGNDAPPTVGGGAPGVPPWPIELLADLHAGVFDDETAAELRARIENDPQARATLDALDATRAALAALPPLRMPDHVAARLDAAVRNEAAGRSATTAPAGQSTAMAGQPPALATMPPPAPLADLAAVRRRRRGLLAGAALLTAAAVTVGIIAVSGLTGGRTAGTPVAGPTTNASDRPLPRLAVSSGNLGAAVGDVLAVADYGPLGSAGRLDACLAANGLDPRTTRPLGAREVTLDGSRPGVLLILPTGTAGRLRLLVVSPDCGPGSSAVLADATIGR
ncbi:MAG TPA: hypothetical protein VGJ95_13250 [Pseudonocardiaceae bacterium]|jgi:hypothetical protein